MRNLFAIGFLAASLVQEQAAIPPPPLPEQSAQPVPQASPENRELIIPAGTRIQVTLSSPIRTKIARRGDAVRAVTAFPVASNGQVAIPAGTYLEGVLEKVLKRGPSGHPGLQMHFTRIVFASGYTVSLQKATAVARTIIPSDNAAPAVAPSSSPGQVAYSEAFGPTPQQPPPTLTPPPMPGPHMGTVIGIGVAVAVAGIVGGILWARHPRGDVVFDVGSPFEVVLDSPVSLQLDRVSAADASPAVP
jgi:hypothetical protein